MSLVDPDHVEPARHRHGAHYYGKADHAGTIKPAMTMYPTESKKRCCPNCGKWCHVIHTATIQDNADNCYYCGTDLSGISYVTVETHK